MNAAQADKLMAEGKIDNWSYDTDGKTVVIKHASTVVTPDPTWAQQAAAEKRGGGAGAGEGK